MVVFNSLSMVMLTILILRQVIQSKDLVQIMKNIKLQVLLS